MAWSVELGEGAKRELARLDKATARCITALLGKRLAALEDPRSLEQALKGPDLGQYRKYRVGD